MKKFFITCITSLIVFGCYSQEVSFIVKSESFTRPDTVVLTNTTNWAIGQQWKIPGGKVINTNDYFQPEITVIYDKPGYYSATLIVEDSDGKIDSLVKNGIIAAPGIIESDQVFCSEGVLKLTATGGKYYLWQGAQSDSALEKTAFQSGYYVATISNDMSFIKSMKDSVKITVAAQVDIPYNDKPYCDSTALLVPNSIVSYKLKNLVFDGEIYSPEADYIGTFTNSKPYYAKNSQFVYINYIDTLGCTWVNDFYEIGENKQQKPEVYLQSIQVCKGEEFTLYSNSYVENSFEWQKDGKIIGTGVDFHGNEIGTYTLKVSDINNVCSVIDSAVVSLVEEIPETLTSINYLPGIGYVSTYSNTQNALPLTLKNTENTIETISNEDFYGKGKMPILIDTSTYFEAPQYTLEGRSSCGNKVVAPPVSPMWLTVEYDFSAGGNSISWTPYTVKNVNTYYIFRGTSPEKMELLAEYPAGQVLKYTDLDAPVGTIYCIGIKDDNQDTRYYKPMLQNWQVGFITSNISPEVMGYSKIGVFAYLPHDRVGSSVYLRAISSHADSIKWDVETSIFNEETQTFFHKGYGKDVEFYFENEGLYDVKVVSYSKQGNDSIYLKDFINIGNPIKFTLDTIYKFIGNDSLYVNISKTIINDVSFIAPKASVMWSIPTQNSNRLVVERKYKENTFSGQPDSLLIWVNPIVGDTIIDTHISGYFIDAYYPSTDFTIIVSSQPNKAPVVKQDFPEIIANNGKQFEPLFLADYISDDYTLVANLKVSLSPSTVFTAKNINGYLYIEQIDGNFKGSETIEMTITDESNLSLTVPFIITQPYLINVPKKLPTASFMANKQYVSPGGIVSFSVQSSNADSLIWNFAGGLQIGGSEANPKVQFYNPGKYSISLTSKNIIGSSVSTKNNYILVTALSPADTTICKGDSITIAVIADGFTSYKWSNSQTTKSIKVSPSSTTSYTVTMTKGLTTVVESINVTIPTQPNLGVDTAFCEGGSLVLNPGTFVSYYWNNSNTAGNNEFEVTKAGKVNVKTIDNKGCIAKDTVTILPLYPKPIIKLGNDTTFCWKKSLTLDASNPNSLYAWSTGEKTKTIKADTTGVYSVTVTNANICSNTASIKINVIVPYVPQLGIITQSSTQKNIIAWQPELNKDIKQYSIWKENASKTFDKIKTINIDDSTYYIDQASLPKTQMYRYAISTVDKTCNNESYLSPIHSSLHLSCVMQKDGTVKATWNNYEGINVSTYIVYRGEKNKPLQKYATVQAEKGATTTFIDTKAIGTNAQYQVGFDLSTNITPSKLKADSGPFSQSLSNLAESELTDDDIQTDRSIVISPNPARTKTSIQTNSTTLLQVIVIDALGKTVLTCTGIQTVELNCSDLLPGVYYVKIITENKAETKTLIIE